MAKYKMQCSCGDTMTVDAGSREQAVAKIQGMMPPAAVAKHMQEKHPSEPVPSQQQVAQMIEQTVSEA